MPHRLILTPFALAGALLGVSTGAFAQSQQGPAPSNGQPPAQYQQNDQQDPQAGPYQNGPDGQMGPGGQNGQGQGGRRMHQPGPMQMALRSLNLSPDQKAQIRNVMQQYRASHQGQGRGQEAYQGQGGPYQGQAQGPDQSQAQGPAPMSRKQMIAQVRSILTPDQQARFADAMRQIRAQRMQNGQGQGQYPGGAQGMGQGQRGPGEQGPGGAQDQGGSQEPN